MAYSGASTHMCNSMDGMIDLKVGSSRETSLIQMGKEQQLPLVLRNRLVDDHLHHHLISLHPGVPSGSFEVKCPFVLELSGMDSWQES